MGKGIAAFGVIYALAILTTCASTGGGTGLSLYDAIEQSAEQIAGNLPSGSRVAIVAFESEHDNLSDYIMEELTGALFDRNIEVADRQNLEYVYKELNFQMSGDVSDETAKSIGKFLAADMVITGQMLNLDSMYRYRTSAINVETAVRASVTRLDVRSDPATKRMFAALANQQTTTKVAKYGVSADVTPQTAGTFLDRGIMFASRGEFEMAIADFDEAIRINPNMSAAYALRARALYASVTRVIGIAENFSSVDSFTASGQITAEQRRIYERAVADFTQAIRLDPNNAKIYSERGGVYDNIGDFDRAIADFTQAIRLDPNYASAYSNRALAYKHVGDLDRAIADFDEAIRIDPNFHAAYDGRADTYYFKRDYDRAVADFTQAIRLNPNHSESYEGRGIIYLMTGDYDRAIPDYNEVIRLKPNFADAYWGRGQAFFLKRDYDRAIADYSQAIRFDPNHTTAYHYRGMAYANKGDLDRAIADWEAVLRIDPNYPNAKQNIENARRERGR